MLSDSSYTIVCIKHKTVESINKKYAFCQFGYE